MTKRKCSKTKIHLRPAEELVPREDWFSFFIKVSEDVHKELGTTSFSNGYRHGDATFWNVLVSSGLVSLFAGAVLTKQGTGKEAWIGKLLLTLRFWGFTIKRVYGDREFSTNDDLALLDIIDVPYTGSMKKTAGISLTPSIEWRGNR